MKTLVAVAFILFITSAVAFRPAPNLPHLPHNIGGQRPIYVVSDDHDNKVMERFVS